MGTVFKKQVTKALPAGAETFVRKGERFARWKVKGKTRTVPLTTGQDLNSLHKSWGRVLLDQPVSRSGTSAAVGSGQPPNTNSASAFTSPTDLSSSTAARASNTHVPANSPSSVQPLPYST